jgi:hypothetical protein
VPTPIRNPPYRRAARLAAALVVLAPLVAAPPSARAEPAPRPSSLNWVRLPGAEACIGSRALAIAVERRLGREVFVSPSRAAVAVEGRVERTAAPPGFRAVITIANEAGKELGNREIHSAAPSCAAMDDDLALVIAVMIDPDAALGPVLPRPPQALPPVVPPPAPPPVPPDREPAPPAWSIGLQAGGMAMLGLMPRISGGVLLRSHVEPPRFWAFEVGGVLFPAVAASQGGASASFQLAEAFVSVCPLTVRVVGTALSACAGVQAGSLRASGFGLAAGTSAELGLFDFALEGRVRRRLVGPLVAAAGLGLVVPVLRARFSYPAQGGAELFSMAPVAGAVDLSLGVEFP